MNVEIAEIYGALLGDGCLSSYFSKYDKRQRYEVSFSGSIDDLDYYQTRIIPFFKRNFFLGGTLRFRHDSKALIYSIKSKRVFDFFTALDFPVGEKENRLKIPTEIIQNSEYAIACLRGVWNTDGSIYRRYTKIYKSHKKFYNKYFVMELKMKAKSLLFQIKPFLDSFGVKTSSITKNQNYVLRINSQEAIQRFLSKISFSNKRHLDRISAFQSKIQSESL
ncbi:MAG: LAGLIDADG family homing endonuclease [archaeon]|nr:LAGLIDADG family homing endonuclease [archaeon]